MPLLLKRGANINAIGGDYGTALVVSVVGRYVAAGPRG